MNDLTFCSEMQELKELLTALVVANGGTTKGSTNTTDTTVADNLYLQYPESTREGTVAAGETVTKNVSVRRRLKYLCVSVPENCVLEIQNNNSTWAWFQDKAGTLQFPTGVYFDALTLKITNAGTEAASYACYMIFA